MRRKRPSGDLARRAAAAFAEPEPEDLGPAARRALRQASDAAYPAALDALRREDWRPFLERVAPAKRRRALRALTDVVPAADLAALEALVPPARRRVAVRSHARG